MVLIHFQLINVWGPLVDVSLVDRNIIYQVAMDIDPEHLVREVPEQHATTIVIPDENEAPFHSPQSSPPSSVGDDKVPEEPKELVLEDLVPEPSPSISGPSTQESTSPLPSPYISATPAEEEVPPTQEAVIVSSQEPSASISPVGLSEQHLHSTLDGKYNKMININLIEHT